MNDGTNEQAAPPVAQTTEQTTAKPAPNCLANLKYIYAEELGGKRCELTIKNVVPDVEFVDGTGRKNKGYDVYFEKAKKPLGVVGATVLRQIASLHGTDYTQWPGKKITLYAVPSKKAATGLAIRVQTT